MKRSLLGVALFAAAVLSVQATVTVSDSKYSYSTYYTDSTGGSIISYDWSSSGDLYYMTSVDWAMGGVYKVSSGTKSTIAAANGSLYNGASVVSLGNYVYYNYSNQANTQYVVKYGSTSGTGASASTASTHSNYGLYTYNNGLFITGAANIGDTNHIYYTTAGSDGSLGTIIDLGATSGASGPLTFDSAGNLYYAPGYYDESIYKWSASEVAAAIAGTSTLTVSGHLWASYGSEYSNVGGATSMIVDANGNLLVTLTSFTSDSVLVNFGTNGTSATTVLSDSDRLGELREDDGTIYLSSGNNILALQTTPEPSTVLFLMAGLGVLVMLKFKYRKVGV